MFARFFFLCCAFFVCLTGCETDPINISPDAHYPRDVGQIMIAKCAQGPCHNPQNSAACAGIDLTTWNSLFRGGKNNACIVPYRPDQSYLLFSVNTFHHFGPQLQPTMPLNGRPLTHDEVESLYNWIAAGAPDDLGHVPFSDKPLRDKIYVANQGCDMVTVFDAETKLVMRCIDVGRTSATEAPHDIQVSPDGDFMYLTFYGGQYIQKYDCRNDQLLAELDLGEISWHSMAISPDSRRAVISHWSSPGKVAVVDLPSMQVESMILGLFTYPHGSSFDSTGRYAYIVCQMGNFIYKADLADLQNLDYEMIPLQTGEQPVIAGPYHPYTVKFTPDYSKYYVSCQGTNEIRVFSSANDSLLRVIPSTGVPQMMEFSATRNLLFVSCMVDTLNTSTQSSVDVIDVPTDTRIKTVYAGYQDRGIAVDDARGVVYVANRNIGATGSAPHHTTSCVGRNGYVTLIDIRTLELVPDWRAEVSVDPYSVALRKK